MIILPQPDIGEVAAGEAQSEIEDNPNSEKELGTFQATRLRSRDGQPPSTMWENFYDLFPKKWIRILVGIILVCLLLSWGKQMFFGSPAVVLKLEIPENLVLPKIELNAGAQSATSSKDVIKNSNGKIESNDVLSSRKSVDSPVSTDLTEPEDSTGPVITEPDAIKNQEQEIKSENLFPV